MKILRKQTITLGVIALATAAFAVTQTASQLLIDGQTASTNVQNVNGHLMVPVDDVARALGYSVQTANGTVNLTKIGAGMTGGAAAQTLNPGALQGVPTSTLSPMGTPVTTPPANIDVNVGADANYGGFTYRVTSIKEAGGEYKQQYDQRGQRLRPRYGADKLVVVNMSVTNSGSTTTYPWTPSGDEAAVFDDQKVGYPLSGVDIMQTPDVTTPGSFDVLPTYGNRSVQLAPGGTLQFALVASLPKDRNVSQVVLNVPASAMTNYSSTTATSATLPPTQPSGATITVHAP